MFHLLNFSFFQYLTPFFLTGEVSRERIPGIGAVLPAPEQYLFDDGAPLD